MQRPNLHSLCHVADTLQVGPTSPYRHCRSYMYTSLHCNGGERERERERERENLLLNVYGGEKAY